MGSGSQSWRELTLGAKVFISLVVVAGTCVLLYGAVRPTSKNIAQFICYLLIAILAARLKVRLAGDHRHHVGELPVHPAGHTGTGLCGDPGFGDRRHPGAVLLSRPPQPAAGHVQSVGERHFDRRRLQRLPPGDLRGAGEEPSPAAGIGRDHLLRRQHRFDRSRDRAHRTQVHQEPVGGMLLLVVPLLPGGRRLRRNDRLVQPRVRMGNVAADRSHHLPDLPVLSAVSGKT